MNAATQDRVHLPRSEYDLAAKVRIMIGMRLLIALIMLIAAGIAHYIALQEHAGLGILETNTIAGLFVYVSITMLLLSIGYLLYYPRCPNMRFFAHIQMTIDLFLETMIIFALGGSGGPFTILYILTIVSASIILGGNSSILFAGLAAALYLWLALAGMFDVQIFNLRQRIGVLNLPKNLVFYFMVTNLGGFFMVGYLSQYATESMRKTDDLLAMHIDHYEDLRFRLRHIIRSIQSGLMTVNLERTVHILNPEGERLLGRREEDVAGKQVDGLFPERIIRRIRRLLHDSEAASAYSEEITYDRDGESIPLSFTISLLRDEQNRKKGILLLFQDMAKIRQLEFHKQMADKWASMAELAANIAHEIRNPLAAMTGSIELLSENPNLDEKDQRLMRVVMRESQRLNRLITDFLDYSRPMALKIEPRDLNEILNGILTMLRASRPEGSNLILSMRTTHKELPALVDLEKINQVFWNLIKNAMEAMSDSGTLTISTSYRWLSPPSSTLIDAGELQGGIEDGHEKGDVLFACVSVEDSGSGIRPEQMEGIFNPFTSYKKSGTGLGLAISYRIIEGHSGHFAVASRIGTGTTFHVLLPSRPSGGTA
ncbi:PAS domain-containing protein [bacterium]|nr:PAS domain-containing protein [candidate division CSSED10-310 bacterium]